MTAAPVVFLDNDGTLIENVPGNVDPARIRFTPGAAAAIRLWHANGYRIAIVTTQPGAAIGQLHESALDAVEARLREMFAGVGVPLTGFFACPHHPDGVVPHLTMRCECRKPLPGLITRAARELDVDPRECWLVGDNLDDVEAGSRAGATTVLLDVGNEDEWRLTPWRIPDYLAYDLLEAAEIVLAVEEAALVVRDRRERRREIPNRRHSPVGGDDTAPSEW